MRGGEEMTHNGWANYDTWLVVVWLDNEIQNYETLQRLSIDDWNMVCEDRMFKDYFYFGDTIDFDAVDQNEIYQHFLEDVERR